MFHWAASLQPIQHDCVFPCIKFVGRDAIASCARELVRESESETGSQDVQSSRPIWISEVSTLRLQGICCLVVPGVSKNLGAPNMEPRCQGSYS